MAENPDNIILEDDNEDTTSSVMQQSFKNTNLYADINKQLET